VTPVVALSLDQNAPNPFNPETTIRFSVPGAARVRLTIYRVDGAYIRTLVDGSLPGGFYHETWDGRDAHGVSLPSGVYFCRLTVDGRSLVRKMVLAK
jgi:flagellar hook assembly protein FlgD